MVPELHHKLTTRLQRGWEEDLHRKEVGWPQVLVSPQHLHLLDASAVEPAQELQMGLKPVVWWQAAKVGVLRPWLPFPKDQPQLRYSRVAAAEVAVQSSKEEELQMQVAVGSVGVRQKYR